MKKILTLCFVLLFCKNAFAISLDELYDVKPEPSSCKEGVLKKSEKLKVLNRLNTIRNLHGLKPVSYNEADDALTAKSALIMQANATLTHTPDKSMKCWSAEGEKGSGKSNIHIYYSSGMKDLEESKNIVAGWLIDDGVDSLGHRRWLIDPFLKHVSFGRVDGKPVVNSEWDTTTGAAISVINNEDADIKDTKTEFVAYPYQNYSNELFKKNWYLSFTALYDRKSSWNNSDAKYENAKITVTDESGNAFSVHSVSHDNTGFGVPNIIQWKVNGLQDNVKYAVKISNVMIEGKAKDYTYWFKLMDKSPEEIADATKPDNNEITSTELIDTHETSLSICSMLFSEGKELYWKTFTKNAPHMSGTMKIVVFDGDYLELAQKVDGSTDTVPFYGTFSGTVLSLVNPSYMEAWHGACYTDGMYGSVKNFYFYIGMNKDITIQDVKKH